MTETEAGRMARTYPELDDRERGALLQENSRQRFADGSPVGPALLRERIEAAQLRWQDR
jgi:hypothetical protein